MIVADEHGSLRVVESMATQGLAGRCFKRRHPEGDEADFLLCIGSTDVGGHEGSIAALVMTPTIFGAIPPGWSSSIEPFPVADFPDEYTEVHDAERALHAAEIQTAARAAQEADEPRESPWSRS